LEPGRIGKEAIAQFQFLNLLPEHSLITCTFFVNDTVLKEINPPVTTDYCSYQKENSRNEHYKLDCCASMRRNVQNHQDERNDHNDDREYARIAQAFLISWEEL